MQKTKKVKVLTAEEETEHKMFHDAFHESVNNIEFQCEEFLKKDAENGQYERIDWLGIKGPVNKGIVNLLVKINTLKNTGEATSMTYPVFPQYRKFTPWEIRNHLAFIELDLEVKMGQLIGLLEEEAKLCNHCEKEYKRSVEMG